MANLECPNCHQKAIPAWRKLFLGPAARVTCPNCGARVGVPWSAMLAVIPFLIAIFIAQTVDSLPIMGAALIVGAGLMIWIHYTFVPLIVK